MEGVIGRLNIMTTTHPHVDTRLVRTNGRRPRAFGICVMAIVLAAGWMLFGRDIQSEFTAATNGADHGFVPAPLRIDLNAADPDTMSLLPGIGHKTAHAIHTDRSDRGPFVTLDAATRVAGVGEMTIDRIDDYAVAATNDPDGSANERALSPRIASTR